MLWSAIQIAFLVYLGLAALIYFKQDALVFQAAMDRSYQATPAAIGLRFDALALPTDDGESPGGAVAAQLASVQRPAALVLASAFTSVPDLGSELYPWLPVQLLALIRYDTRERLGSIKVTVLVIHSRGDDIIPFAHGERLYAAAGRSGQFLEIEGGHNDGFVFNRDEWIHQLDGFLRKVLAAWPAQAPSAVQ